MLLVYEIFSRLATETLQRRSQLALVLQKRPFSGPLSMPARLPVECLEPPKPWLLGMFQWLPLPSCVTFSPVTVTFPRQQLPEKLPLLPLSSAISWLAKPTLPP